MFDTLSYGYIAALTHASRLLDGLVTMRVACWPYSGAIGLTERHEDHPQIHVIRNWCYLGCSQGTGG